MKNKNLILSILERMTGGVAHIKDLITSYQKKIIEISPSLAIMEQFTSGNEEEIEKVMSACEEAEEIAQKIKEEINKNDFISERNKEKLREKLERCRSITFRLYTTGESQYPVADILQEFHQNIKEMHAILNRYREYATVLLLLVIALIIGVLCQI